MADNNLVTIKKIKVGENLHEIDAKYLGGYTFEEIQGMVQGIVGTFVISESKNNVEGYEDVVKSTESTVDTTSSVLNALTGNTESYKVGDIILMEEVSDGEKIFDRWVSKVDDENITLAVLETQVAKHHHEIESTTGSALVGYEVESTIAVPTVGEAVTVLTGAAGDVLTSFDSETYEKTGSHDLTLVSASDGEDGALGHSHTIASHEHSVTFNPHNFVSDDERVSVITVLSTDKFASHTHETVTVAGTYTDVSALTYANGEGDTAEFIKTLVDSEELSTTNSSAFESGANVNGLATDEQTDKDAIGDLVKTTSSGAHEHTVSGVTTSDVITEVTLAENVITSVVLSYVGPTIESTVVTSVAPTYTSVVSSVVATPSTASFFNSCSVDEDGILSFSAGDAVTDVTVSTSLVSVVSDVAVSSGSQSDGSASISATSFVQSFVSDVVAISGTAAESGAHTHGFSHTHTIPSHTHEIGAHSHKYVKSVASEMANAYISLGTSSYVPHTHESNVSVAAAYTDENEITYVTGGSTTLVVKDLVNNDLSYATTGGSEMVTGTNYAKVSGDITFPTLSFGKATLSTTTVTPAVATENTAVASISFTSGNFVTGVSDVTGVNIGGDPKTKTDGE
jgi:hypothetical protein